MNVAVIIPVFNGAETLARAIESAQAATCHVQVIVVDDNSKDGSSNIAIENHADVVRLGHRRGQSYARNIGISTAHQNTDFIQFLDADDWLEPGKIDAHVAVLTSDETLDVTWGPLRVLGPKLDRIVEQSEIQRIYPQFVNVCPQTNSMFFRKRILTGKPWPEELRTKYKGGTPYFWQRILKRQPGVRYSPAGVAVYNVGNPESLSRSLPMYYSEDPQWPYP